MGVLWLIQRLSRAGQLMITLMAERLADPGVDQKPLAVGRDGVVGPVWIARKWHADVEERLGAAAPNAFPPGTATLISVPRDAR